MICQQGSIMIMNKFFSNILSLCFFISFTCHSMERPIKDFWDFPFAKAWKIFNQVPNVPAEFVQKCVKELDQQPEAGAPRNFFHIAQDYVGMLCHAEKDRRKGEILTRFKHTIILHAYKHAINAVMSRHIITHDVLALGYILTGNRNAQTTLAEWEFEWGKIKERVAGYGGCMPTLMSANDNKRGASEAQKDTKEAKRVKVVEQKTEGMKLRSGKKL